VEEGRRELKSGEVGRRERGKGARPSDCWKRRLRSIRELLYYSISNLLHLLYPAQDRAVQGDRRSVEHAALFPSIPVARLALPLDALTMVRISSSLLLLAAAAVPHVQATGPFELITQAGQTIGRGVLKNVLRLDDDKVERIMNNEAAQPEPHPYARE